MEEIPLNNFQPAPVAPPPVADYFPLPPMAPRPPRIWPALTLGICIIPVGAIVAGVVLAFYLVATKAIHFQPGENIQRAAFKAMEKPVGFLVMILPGQFTFLFAAIGAAALSPQPFARRLGYVRSRLPIWSYPFLAAATLFFGVLGGALMHLVKGGDDQMKMLSNSVAAARGGFLIIIAATIGILPAITEETLFRGYVQRRLLERWGAFGAIAVSTILFSVAHLDPGHVLGVVLIGMWLGIVAWRAGSLWPSMFCHAALNLTFVLGNRFGDHDENMRLDRGLITMLTISGAAVLFSIYLMRRYRVT